MNNRWPLDPAAHVTLVLGAGGAVGRAFHAGVLRALADHEWDARSADLIVGTSAGSQVGALLRFGWTAQQLFERAPTLAARPLRPSDDTRSRWPASPRYLRSVLTTPWRARIGPLVAALLPEGTNADDRLGAGFAIGQPWPARPLWIPAIEIDSGRRVVFGRADAPIVDVATAVRCSSAVPGLSQPVRVGSERYVDGGITSPTHATLASCAAVSARVSRHTAVVLSPLSSFAVLRLLLRAELAALRRRGIEVALFEPDRDVNAAMGWNPMNPLRARAVAELAYRATLSSLDRSCRRHRSSYLRVVGPSCGPEEQRR